MKTRNLSRSARARQLSASPRAPLPEYAKPFQPNEGRSWLKPLQTESLKPLASPKAQVPTFHDRLNQLHHSSTSKSFILTAVPRRQLPEAHHREERAGFDVVRDAECVERLAHGDCRAFDLSQRAKINNLSWCASSDGNMTFHMPFGAYRRCLRT